MVEPPVGRWSRPKIGLIAGALVALGVAGYLAVPKPEGRRETAPPAPVGAVLGGYVIDAETREPLAGVALMVMDGDTLDGRAATRTSDPQGRFRFDGLRPGSGPQVRLVARKDGYHPSATDPPLGATAYPVTLHPVSRTEDHP